MNKSISGVFVLGVMSLMGCQSAQSVDGTITGSVTGSVSKSKQPSNAYETLIKRHAKQNGVPVDLARAIVEVESNFRPNVRGNSGEIGLMQIKPATARGIGFKGSVKELYLPENNIKYGMKYLGDAYRLGGETICGAVLKYNAGHYAKQMNPVSRNYCKKVKALMN